MIQRILINTPNAPQPRAPISQAVVSNGLVFVSGITPFDLELKIAKGDFDAQFSQTASNLRAILEAASSGFDQILKCTIILARREDWRRMNELYAALWPNGDYPARTAFEALLPHPDFLLEIECVASVLNKKFAGELDSPLSERLAQK